MVKIELRRQPKPTCGIQSNGKALNRIQAWDPSEDTQVVILHTVTLGPIKNRSTEPSQQIDERRARASSLAAYD